jgi:hypothetical protein
MTDELGLSSEAVDAFLAAAGWRLGATENLAIRETLPFDYVAQVIQIARAFPLPDGSGLPVDPAHRSAYVALGLICLTLGVAQWGLTGAPANLSDPQMDDWKGAPKGRGKHLVSVRDGGIGLPHFDVGDLSELLRFALSVQPGIGESGSRRRVEDLAHRFDNGLKYKHLNPREDGTTAETTDWDALVHFCEEALGRREVEHWVLARWLKKYWVRSLQQVIAAGGSIPEAFINARIRNSSPRNAACALAYAQGKPNRIKAEIDAYVDKAICPDAKNRHRTRAGYMQRPVAMWNY